MILPIENKNVSEYTKTIYLRIFIGYTIGIIDDLHISHNASGMGANIRVLLIRNSSSHSSLDVNGFELPCLRQQCVLRDYVTHGNSLMRSWC